MVLLSAEEYKRLRGKDRAVGLAGDISDKMLAAVMAAKAPEAASAFDHEGEIGGVSGPRTALVIRYSYLWHSEFLAGREEGIKDRPCVIVAAVKRDAGQVRAVVLPVTHTPPDDPDAAIEIPMETKTRLGLDSERSWIVVSQWNEFHLARPGSAHGAGRAAKVPPLMASCRRNCSRRFRPRSPGGSRRIGLFALHGLSDRD